MTADRARELIERHLDGVASETETAELDALLAKSPEAARLFADLSRREQLLEGSFRHEEAVERFRARFPRPSRRPWIAAAAAVLIAAALFFAIRPGPAIVGNVLSADGATVERGGSTRPVAAGDVLRDGDLLRDRVSIGLPGERSHIDLRPGAALTLHRGRAELARGEIEAVIAPRTGEHALLFATPHAEARILGTRFTLTAAADRSRLEVFEGRVRFERLSDRRAVEVRTKECAVAAPTEKLEAGPIRSVHDDRFLELWRELHDPANGYFSPDGVPYHSIETFIVDAPDYGHLTTSETFSYWLWLEAAYGRLTGDWAPLNAAWRKMEETLIPANRSAYDPKKPATYVPEADTPQQYPVAMDPAVPVGEDPLARELEAVHGPGVYAMHWLLDVDNWYGFGRKNNLVNTYQRGPQESVWETIPHPSVETFAAGGPNGFLDLFIRENSYAKQWRYTCAPDADARAVQALYWASRWAHEQKRDSAKTVPVRQAAKMGDFLRYALHDKYFRGSHGLLAWSYAWGGAMDGSWGWRSGSSHVHFGYQNPFAAWVLGELKDFATPSPNGGRDWQRSLRRQVEFYRWLQSTDGAIAGGATGSWRGRYETPPAGTSTFHGLAYEAHPVFRDPDSNEWFGWQAWSMERLAQYAEVTQNPQAQAIVRKWAAWARREVKLEADGGYSIPSTLRWSGQPDPWNPDAPGPNAGLRVRVADRTQDVGVAAALARALVYESSPESRRTAKELLDRMWARHRDEKGVSNPESPNLRRMFEGEVAVPAGWKGPLKPGATFLDVRPQYRKDPEFARVEAALRRGEAPVFRYHRFWAQVEVALAHAEYSRLDR